MIGRKSGRMSEKRLEQLLHREVLKRGGRTYKFVSPGNTGVPDRVVLLPGHPPYFVELKTDTGRLSQVQKVQIERFKKAGQKVYVTYGLEGIEKFLEKVDG